MNTYPCISLPKLYQKVIEPFLGWIISSLKGLQNAVAPPASTLFKYPIIVPKISPVNFSLWTGGKSYNPAPSIIRKEKKINEKGKWFVLDELVGYF